MSGATRAELQEEIDRLKGLAESWMNHRLSDDEAQAISECSKALAALTLRPPSGSYNRTEQADTWACDRVLAYLTVRFGTPAQAEVAQADQWMDGISLSREDIAGAVAELLTKAKS